MKEPVMMDLNESAFSPMVLTSYRFSQWSSYSKGWLLRPRRIYDYEFELITESDGAMVLDGKTYELQKGDLIFRKPGQYTQAIMRYNCYAVFFDITGQSGKKPGIYDMHVDQPMQPLYENPVISSIPTQTKTGLTNDYLDIFQSILNHFINPAPGSLIESRALLLQLIKKLYTEATSGFHLYGKLSGPHYLTLKKVLSFMEKNQNRKISLQDIAEVAGLSPNYFHNIFTSALGVTPNTYLIELKMRNAKELLAGSTHSVAEISELCGFDNIPYFSSLFSKKAGCSPSEFRKKHSPRL